MLLVIFRCDDDENGAGDDKLIWNRCSHPHPFHVCTPDRRSLPWLPSPFPAVPKASEMIETVAVIHSSLMLAVMRLAQQKGVLIEGLQGYSWKELSSLAD